MSIPTLTLPQLLLRDAPCGGSYTWSHADITTRVTSALMCFPPGTAAFKHSAEWLEATMEEAKAVVVAGGRPSLGAHEARALVVSNTTDKPIRVIVEISTQAAPLYVTIASNAWATSVLARIDATAAAAAQIAAAETEAPTESESPIVSEEQGQQTSDNATDNATAAAALPSPCVVPPPFSSDAAFVGASTFRCAGISCFEMTAAPGRAVYSISCGCPDMALAQGVAGAPPASLGMGGFCIRFRSDAELQCATEAEAYASLGFVVQEAFAQAASLDEWVDDHVAVASLKLGSCVHPLLQQLLLPSPSLAPFVTSTRFLPQPSSISNSVVGLAPALIRSAPPPDGDAAAEHTIIVHFAPPFELKPEAPPLPAILRVVAAPGDSATLEAAAAGVWSEHSGSYAENFR